MGPGVPTLGRLTSLADAKRYGLLADEAVGVERCAAAQVTSDARAVTLEVLR